MYRQKSIAVVVPAHNEEQFIEEVVTTVPAFVDRIYAVNDASTDGTRRILEALHCPRLGIINHASRQGAGAAMISGYRQAGLDGIDVIAIMAGDAQMDPDILDQILDPVITGHAGYSKGDRLGQSGNSRGMPPWRLLGNTLLTGIIKVASGYWHLNDPLNGYTAISREALQRINLEKVERGYAFETDLLIKLNAGGVRAVNVPMRARYGREKSKIVYHKFIVYTSWVIIRDYIWRLAMKVIRRKEERNTEYVESSGHRRWSHGRESRPDIL